MGSYPSTEQPFKGCDNNLFSKSLNFGSCSSGAGGPFCGLKTGMYVTPTRNASLAIGLQLCTGDDHPERDPTNITLEGSNANGTKLTLGSSWTLMHNGTSGLDIDPGRYICGDVVWFPNTMTFTSYRMLITARRDITDDSAQYSEFKLLGT